MSRFESIGGEAMWTTGSMSDETGEPLWRILYAIKSRAIPASARLGSARVYDDRAFAQVKAAIQEIKSSRVGRPSVA